MGSGFRWMLRAFSICLFFIAWCNETYCDSTVPELIKPPTRNAAINLGIYASKEHIEVSDDFFRPSAIAASYVDSTTCVPEIRNFTLTSVPPAGANKHCTKSIEGRSIAVLIPGYGLDKASMFAFVKHLAKLGYASMLIDPPGQGQSAGTYIGFGHYEAKKMSELVHNVRQAVGPSGHILVLGYSYGAAIALDLAAVEASVDGVVAIAPFANVMSAVKGALATGTLSRNRHRQKSDSVDGALREQFVLADRILGYSLEHSGPIDFARNIRAPVLLITSDGDLTAPQRDVADIGKKIFHQRLTILERLSHEQLLIGADTYFDRVIGCWLRSTGL